jgi:hypothetical protein
MKKTTKQTASAKVIQKTNVPATTTSSKKSPYIKKQITNFIAQCYKDVPSENAYDYIQWKLGLLATSVGLNKEESGYQIKEALSEMLDKKVSKNSIMDLVRIAKYDMMYHLFLAIEDPLKKNHKWGFYIEDQDGQPIYKIQSEELSVGFDEGEFLPRNIKKKLSTTAKKK